MNSKKQTLEYKERHNLGQFFTDGLLVEEIVKTFKINFKNKDVLEPSFGNCSFVKYINKSEPSAKITAVDISKKLCNKFKQEYKEVEFINKDFLSLPEDKKFDVIIGNPPFNLKTPYDYYNTTEGFVLKSMKMLKSDGILCFILPSTFLRNKQYENARKVIIDNYKIVGILNITGSKFDDADVETIALCIKNCSAKKQEYKYYEKNKLKLISLKPNTRYNILINNTDTYKLIISKCEPQNIGDKFDIYRGKSKNKEFLNGRKINFYKQVLKYNNDEVYFIAQQNIAYRFTCNVIEGSIENVTETVTMLVPKRKFSKKYLIFISEFLNSSVANYLLHINCLNECKLTVHMDKYYFEDIKLPTYDKNFEKYLDKCVSLQGTRELGIIRNEYFYKLFKFNAEEIEEIERIWSFPRYKVK